MSHQGRFTTAAAAYFAVWKKIDEMIKNGRGDTPEADLLREEADPLWRNLSQEEREGVATEALRLHKEKKQREKEGESKR